MLCPAAWIVLELVHQHLLLEMLVLVLVLLNPQAPVSNVLTGACGMLV